MGDVSAMVPGPSFQSRLATCRRDCRGGFWSFTAPARGNAFFIPGRGVFSRRPLKPRSRGVGQASRLLPPPGRSSRLCP
ncbi:hypothetical protein XarjCFBP7653_01325 [Xanthomonas arboricola]|nr:hypothetical protein XarjCFBP7653_01325 [Xanthomonas arboricola]